VTAARSRVEHVVIIVKENHGFDNYFGAFPGADGMPLPEGPNPPPADPDHRHAAWLAREHGAPRVSFSRSTIPRYWDYASSFTLCDRYFTDVAGPSTPNHLMLVMADSPLIDNPPTNYRQHPGPPMFDQPSLPAQLDAAGLSWANYNGYVFEFIAHTAGKMRPGSDFARDASAGTLPAVSWLYAAETLSEHPADTPSQRGEEMGDVRKGSDWTASQVDAIVAAGLWPRTAIFITWDDWGGWWDHVTPPDVERWKDGTQFRYGGRVPCLVLGPYARRAHISKRVHSHVSIVRFCEDNFGLEPLNARAAASDGMEDCFDFAQDPLPPPQPSSAPSSFHP